VLLAEPTAKPAKLSSPRTMMLVLLLALLAAPPALVAAPAGPSILIACPQTPSTFPGDWISMGWMRALANGTHGAPVQVDYTTSLSELNRTRLSRYTSVLLFESPAGALARSEAQGGPEGPLTPAGAAGFTGELGEYVSKGGGLFIFPSEDNWKDFMMPDVYDFFGLRLGVEIINETNPANVGAMTRFPRALAFTDNVVVPSHPAVKGVKQLWYPTEQHYNAGETGPLCLTAAGSSCEGPSNWTALIRASKTAVTQAVVLSTAGSGYKPWPPHLFQRKNPVHAPPIFAVRTYGKGRVAAMAQWRQYTLNSGEKWLFDSQILSKGVGARPSNGGQLLQSAIEWLATPVPGGPGGFTDSSSTLVFPNDRPAGRPPMAFGEGTNQPGQHPYHYNRSKLDENPALPGLVTTRGVIGVRTALSSGEGFWRVLACFDPI
jgi:hypothetical protein